MRGKGQKAGIGKLFFLLEKDRGRYLFFVFANAAFYSVGQLLQAFCTGRIVSVAQEGNPRGLFSLAAMLAGSLCAMTVACFCKREIGFCTDGMNARIRELLKEREEPERFLESESGNGESVGQC